MARRRSKRQPALMGSHNRCWLWGRHLVSETLAAGRWPIVEMRLSEDLPRARRADLLNRARECSISVTFEPAARLTQLCGASDHQGHLAKMRPFPYVNFDMLLANLTQTPLLGLLDGIQDPHNFGAIVRSAEVLGVDGLIVQHSRQAEVTAAVARSSAGAVNHLPISRVDDLVSAARRLQTEFGISLVAADHHGTTLPAQMDAAQPTAVVIGNEARGVSDGLRALCDTQVCIPQIGQTESLNAAAAAGILFYEVRRQRQPTIDTE